VHPGGTTEDSGRGCGPVTVRRMGVRGELTFFEVHRAHGVSQVVSGYPHADQLHCVGKGPKTQGVCTPGNSTPAKKERKERQIG